MLFADDADRRRFLRRLHTVVRRYGWRCTAYCLLGTHYHLVVETPRPNLALGIQALNRFTLEGSTSGVAAMAMCSASGTPRP